MMKALLLVLLFLVVASGVLAQEPKASEALTADEQVMVSTLSALYALHQAACAELDVSKTFQAEAARVLARVQANHPGATALIRAEGAILSIHFAEVGR